MTDPKVLLKSLEEKNGEKRTENRRKFLLYIKELVNKEMETELNDIFKELYCEFEKYMKTKIPEPIIIGMGTFALGIVSFGFYQIKGKKLQM